MKKKLFLTLLIVSVLVCVFAISISAVTYTYKDENGNMLFSYNYETVTAADFSRDKGFGSNSSAWIASNKQGIGFAKEDAEGNELTWYITNTETDDAGNKTFTVASLKTMGEAGNINGSGAYNFIAPVTNKNTVSVNFPDDAGIKSFGFGSFGGHLTYFDNNILFVYCPNTLTTFSRAFQETPVMVVEIDDETPITNIPQNFAHEARNLTSINIPASVEIIYGNGTNDGTPFWRNASLTQVTFASNENLKEIKMNAFLECKSLQICKIPDSVTTIGSGAFRYTALRESPFTKNSQCTSIGQYAFRECSSMTNFILPAGITELNSDGYCFQGCSSLVTFDWNGNNSITVIPQSCFNGCSSLVSIDMPKTVEVLSNYCFSSCSSLTEISISNSVETIANHAFAWCSSLEVIRMGNSFAYFNNTGDNSFTYSAGKVKEIYIPKSFYATAPDASLKYKVSYAFAGVTSDCKFFYCGTVGEFEIAKTNFLTQVSATSNNGRFINAQVITYSDYINPDNAGKYDKGNYVICEYNTCTAFYGDEHNTLAPTYGFNGPKYISEFCSFAKCERCPSTVEAKVVDPLFTSKGYSKSDDAFMYDIKVNFDAIEAYKAFCKTTLEKDVTLNYGLVVSGNSAYTTLLNADGSVKGDDVLKMIFDDTVYTNVQIKINNINTDAFKATYVHACAYIIEDGAISYIGDGITADVATTICYNDINEE